TGNVLFADPLPPALIDLSIYYRPAAYASAIVVADALAWEEATAADLEGVISTSGFGQLMARALLFRIVTDWLADPHAAEVRASTYSSAVDLAIELVERDE
ncbi:MAG: TIGR02569 family protein, partial [Acidimicrobiales bacterium]